MADTAPINPPQYVAANHFTWSGGEIHVTYAPIIEAELPLFVYQDATQTLTFRGPAIQSTSTDAGTLVTVIIRKTIDAGSTSFSVLVPRVQVPQGGSSPVSTNGITAIHRFSTAPFLNRGQLDFYTTTLLTGAASHVMLPAATTA
jgi:hypothetical protein